MRILFCGDRNWTNESLIKEELLKFDTTRDIIIHGCARGADRIAGYTAKELGFKVEAFPAQWDLYGRAAGAIRNRQMLNTKPDFVIAFHNNILESKGTANCVKTAKHRGISVKLVTEHA